MKKKLHILIALAIITTVTCIGIGLNRDSVSEKSVYNMNPDVSSKVIGSEMIRNSAWLIPIKSIEDLVSYADLIVIGEVISDGVTKTEEWPKVEGDPQGQLDISNRSPMSVSHTKVKISKTLYGKANSDTITLLQLGKSGDDRGETKVKKNKKMLLVLKDSKDGRNIYSSVCYEDGLFEINNDNKVKAFSKELVMAKYDDTDIDLLEKDIIKALKNK